MSEDKGKKPRCVVIEKPDYVTIGPNVTLLPGKWWRCELHKCEGYGGTCIMCALLAEMN